MKIKNKGRKIYKTKEKNYYGKSPAAKVLSASLTVLLIGGIGFIGYSVAGPVIDFTKKKGDETVDTDDAVYTEDYTSIEPSSDEAAVQPETSSKTSSSAGTTMTTAAEDTVMSHMVDAGTYHAYALSEDDMVSIDAIKEAVKAIPDPQDIDFIEVPLKLAGGKVLYATQAREAAFTGALQSSLKAEEIAEAITDAGFRPAAHISTFRDHIVPATLPETGYSFEDGSSQWLDNKPEKDGKPWLDPFSDQAVGYVSFLSGEAAGAGFERVICSDFVFPSFFDSDYDLLGDRYKEEERYLAMTSAANQIYDSILSNGSSMMLEVSAGDMLMGKNDIVKPMVLSANTIVIDINCSDLKTLSDSGKISGISGSSSDIITDVYTRLRDQLSDFNVVVRISGDVSDDEVKAAKQKLKDAGCGSYIISTSKSKPAVQETTETTQNSEETTDTFYTDDYSQDQ